MKFVVKVDDQWLATQSVYAEPVLTSDRSKAAVFHEVDPNLIISQIRSMSKKGQKVSHEEDDREPPLLPTYPVNRCPFCEQRLDSFNDISDDKFFMNTTYYFVHCSNCEARGPLSDNECEAAENWNGLYPRSSATRLEQCVSIDIRETLEILHREEADLANAIKSLNDPSKDPKDLKIIEMYKKDAENGLKFAWQLVFEQIKTPEDLEILVNALRTRKGEET